MSVLAACALVLVAATGCGGGAGADPKVQAAAKATTTVAPAPPTTAATTTTAPAALPGDGEGERDNPVPASPAARSATPRGPEPRTLTVTGRIEIPKIGLSHTTYEGIALRTIDNGPSHWPGTALPGQAGNTVFAGHRVTHSRPFFDIDRVAVGDQVIFTNDAGRHVYEVTETLVVAPNALWIADPTPGSTFTIFGCHPKGSARQRYVARGRLQSSTAPQVAPAPGAPAPAGGGSAPAGGGSAPPPPTTTTTVSPLCLLCPLLQR